MSDIDDLKAPRVVRFSNFSGGFVLGLGTLDVQFRNFIPSTIDLLQISDERLFSKEYFARKQEVVEDEVEEKFNCRFEKYFQSGKDFLANGDYKNASESFKQASDEKSSDSEHLRFYLLHGKCLCLDREFGEAEKAFSGFLQVFSRLSREEKLALSELGARVYDCRGFCRLELMLPEKAVSDFKKCLSYSRFDSQDIQDQFQRSVIEGRIAYCKYFLEIPRRLLLDTVTTGDQVIEFSKPLDKIIERLVKIYFNNLERVSQSNGSSPKDDSFLNSIVKFMIVVYEMKAIYMVSLPPLLLARFIFENFYQTKELLTIPIEKILFTPHLKENLEISRVYISGCYFLRGICYVVLSLYQKAIDDFNFIYDLYKRRYVEDAKEVEWSVSLVRLLFFRGVAHNELGNFELALEDYNDAIEIINSKQQTVEVEDENDKGRRKKENWGIFKQPNPVGPSVVLHKNRSFLANSVFLNRSLIHYKFGNVEEGRRDYQEVLKGKSLSGMFLAQVARGNFRGSGVTFVGFFGSMAIYLGYTDEHGDKIDNKAVAFMMEGKEKKNASHSDGVNIDKHITKLRYCRYCMKIPKKKKRNKSMVKMMRCGGCKKSTGENIYYCSRACQTGDWKYHKKVCGK